MVSNQKLTQLRTEANLNLRQFGFQLGVTPEAVYNWERGYNSPSKENIKAICEFFDVAPEDAGLSS